MQRAMPSFLAIRRRIEDFPALATLLGLILISIIPYLQYHAWVLEGINQAQEAYESGMHAYDVGDFSTASYYYDRAYGLYNRSMFSSSRTLNGKLELAQGYQRLLAQNYNGYSTFQNAVRIYVNLVNSKNHSLEGLAGLKTIEIYQGVYDYVSQNTFERVHKSIDELTKDLDNLDNLSGIEQKQDAARYYYLLGKNHELQFNFDQARADYKEAVNQDSTQKDYQEALDRMEKLGEVSSTKEACERLVRIDPQNLEYRLCLLQEYRKNGQTEDLFRVYDDMLLVFKEDNKFVLDDAAAAYYKWGQTQVGKGDFEGALRAFRKALQLNPENETYKTAAEAQVVILDIQITVRDVNNLPVDDAVAIISSGDEIGRSDSAGLIQANFPYLFVPGNSPQIYVLSEESGFYNVYYFYISPPQTTYSVTAYYIDESQTLSTATSSSMAGNKKAAELLYTFLVTQVLKESNANLSNSVCWNGSIDGFAALVLPACEQAVAMAPEVGAYVDSRGLARALTGDSAGAIEDFEFFIQWAPTNGFPDRVAQRKEWIKALEEGQNPFNPEVLNAIRDQ